MAQYGSVHNRQSIAFDLVISNLNYRCTHTWYRLGVKPKIGTCVLPLGPFNLWVGYLSKNILPILIRPLVSSSKIRRYNYRKTSWPNLATWSTSSSENQLECVVSKTYLEINKDENLSCFWNRKSHIWQKCDFIKDWYDAIQRKLQ